MLSGIYQITCVRNGQIYVGSSKNIPKRWAEHRRALRKGRSNCRYLQHAWIKHGEASFRFHVIEECIEESLEGREQFYIDTLRPAFNSITDVKRRFGKEMRDKIAASLRAKAALVTHCPKGHPYDEANTYRNKKGKRICRACNAERVLRIYASATPEQREARQVQAHQNYIKNREVRLAQQREYASSRKDERREYYRRWRLLKKANMSDAAL